MCHFHGYSEEKTPLPWDEKLPPAKMSAYRCPFYGYIIYHEKLTKIQSNPFLHVGVRTNPDSKAIRNSLSSPLSIHKIRSFWPSCGGGLSEWKTTSFSIVFFSGSGLYFVCGAFSMAIARKKRLFLAMTSYHQLR